MSPPFGSRSGREPSPYCQPARHDGDDDELPEDFCSGGEDDGYGYAPAEARRQVVNRYWAQHSLMRTRRTLVGLEWREPYWVGELDVPFRPEGLIVMSAPVGAMLQEWCVGVDRVLPAGRSPLLLSTFVSIEQGRYESARPHYSTCGPGVPMRLRLVSRAGQPLPPDDVELTVWGIASVHI